MLGLSFTKFLKFNTFPKLSKKYYYKHRYDSTKARSSVYYIIGTGVFMFGLTYAGVPIYRTFCQKTGIGGNTDLARVKSYDIIHKMKPIRKRPITVEFDCDKDTNLMWNFHPLQKSLKIVPGETALAFYRASNPTDEPIVGIATYNILPYEAGKYFHKIQCFCFEEQRLNPKDEVDMPIFFYLDPAFDDDFNLMHTEDILLTYTFFAAKEALKLPLPGFLTSK